MNQTDDPDTPRVDGPGPSEPPPVSPLATGGAGTVFEYRVAAVALGALLRNDSIVGLGSSVRLVGLQQRILGHPLDDVVALGSSAPGLDLHVEHQVKRTLQLVASDEDFRGVIRQCLTALGQDPDGIENGRHRLGIAAGGPVGPLTDLRELTEIARAHASSGSFQTALTSSRAAVRQRHDHLREAVRIVRADLANAVPSEEEVGELSWRVARALAVWIVEVGPDGRDALHAIDRLRDLLPQGSPVSAGSLFEQLASIAETWGPRATRIDAPMLRAELERRGVALSSDPKERAALEGFVERSGRFLAAIPTSLGGTLKLPRATLLDALIQQAIEQTAVLLHGPAGVGKTTLAAQALQRVSEAGGTVVAFSLTGRAGHRLAALETELGVGLPSTLRAAPTSRPRVLFIDGAEQVLTDSGALLRDVLGTVPTTGDDAPPWHVLITARDEAAEVVAAFITEALGHNPAQLFVDDLTDDEVSEVLTAFPALAPLDRHERPRRLLRRPYLVDLLVRATMHATVPQAVLAEEDVVDLVSERLVRRAEGAVPGLGAPDARNDIYLALADAAVAEQTPTRLDGRDPLALQGLVSDDILVRLRASYQFAHEILTDYAVVSRLLEAGGHDLVTALPSPRRLLRAIRLWMQHRLANTEDADVERTWDELQGLAEELATTDGPRWSDVPFEALLSLGRLREVLAALQALLLSNNGATLGRLVDVTERLARPRIPAGGDVEEPELDVVLAAPVVAFLAQCGLSLPQALWPAAARLARIWLANLALVDDVRKAGLLPEEGTLSEAVQAWAGQEDWRDQFEDALLAVALLGEHLDDSGRRFLVDRAEERPHTIDVVVENPTAARLLAQHDPNLLLALAGAFYINRRLTLDSSERLPRSQGVISQAWPHVELSRRHLLLDDDDEDDDELQEEGVRDSSPHRIQNRQGLGILADPSIGPFATMLASSPRHGLRLIGAVVDAATVARIRVEATWQAEPITLHLQLQGWPDARTYRGTADVWAWYRRTTVGSYTAMSALMALRAWAVRQIAEGSPIHQVIEDILSCGGSLAFVAVAFSLLVQRLEDVPEEFDDFLVHPLIWHLENSRVVHEHSGLALPVGDAPRIAMGPSQVAMELVMRSNHDRRERLKETGERLVASRDGLSPSPDDASPTEDAAVSADQIPAEEMLVRGRWAAELNINKYQAQRAGDQVQISIDYPEDVVKGLDESGGRRSAQYLELSSLGFQAMQVRDGELDTDPVPIWERLRSLRDELGGTEEELAPLRFADAQAAAAAAIAARAAKGGEVDDATLRAAAQEFIAAAGRVREEHLEERPFRERRMVWPMGADRSAAMALPLLLVDDALRARSGISREQLNGALAGLAGSVFAEVRVRLAQALQAAWDRDCASDPFVHDTALSVFREMVASSGFGPWNQNGYPHVHLREPIEAVLETASELVVMPAGAADGLTGLIGAAARACPHGDTAARLLDALVEFDLRVWPTELARHRFDVGAWRGELDRLTAERTLDGDPAQLRRYIAEFAPVAEDLTGLLIALAAAATTPERAGALHDIWPELLDALLPDARSLDRDRGRGPYHRDVDALDAALLPIPPENAGWPLERTAQLFWRWHAAFQHVPHVVDHCIEFFMRAGWLLSPHAVGAVLGLLGDHAETILHESRLVVPWLDLLLRVRPQAAGEHAPALRALLDRLAAAGDEGALRVQRALEA